MYLELKHHAPQLKKIINDQHSRLGDAQKKLLKIEEQEAILPKRIDRAIQTQFFGRALATFKELTLCSQKTTVQSRAAV